MESDSNLGLPLPMRFSYEQKWLWIGGFSLTAIALAVGVLGCLSDGLEAHLSGLLFIVMGLIIGLASANAMFLTSSVVLDATGVSWSLLGWRWRFVDWSTIGEIKIQALVNYKTGIVTRTYSLVEKSQSRFYPAVFTDNIEDFPRLKIIFNFYIKKYKIVVVSGVDGASREFALN